MQSFNPRTHTGCDINDRSRTIDKTVSIHAPTRGATQVHKPTKTNYYVSIHAPTRGATRPQSRMIVGMGFQSTHPHGVRHPFRYLYCCEYGVSIHAPTRGATSTEITLRALSRVSIHAPTRGATQTSKLEQIYTSSFNPRTHTGCDSFGPH